MCYGCVMCNKCGKYDWLADFRRRCPSCKKEPPPEALICPDCGAQLPPPFPGPPGNVPLKAKI